VWAVRVVSWNGSVFCLHLIFFTSYIFSYSELLNWEDWKRLQLLQRMQVFFFGFISCLKVFFFGLISCLTVCPTCSLVANMRIALFFWSVLESFFPPPFLLWHFVVFNIQFSWSVGSGYSYLCDIQISYRYVVLKTSELSNFTFIIWCKSWSLELVSYCGSSS